MKLVKRYQTQLQVLKRKNSSVSIMQNIFFDSFFRGTVQSKIEQAMAEAIRDGIDYTRTVLELSQNEFNAVREVLRRGNYFKGQCEMGLATDTPDIVVNVWLSDDETQNILGRYMIVVTG